MPVRATYETYPNWTDRPVVMSGVFKTRELYERFKKNESRRSCYRPTPFKDLEVNDINEDEYELIRCLVARPCAYDALTPQ